MERYASALRAPEADVDALTLLRERQMMLDREAGKRNTVDCMDRY